MYTVSCPQYFHFKIYTDLPFNLHLSSSPITTSAGKKPHSDLNLGPRGCAISRDAKPVATCTSSPSCVMWIHLQTSICTEWEHSSMVSYSKPTTMFACTAPSPRLIPCCNLCEGYTFSNYKYSNSHT